MMIKVILFVKENVCVYVCVCGSSQREGAYVWEYMWSIIRRRCKIFLLLCCVLFIIRHLGCNHVCLTCMMYFHITVEGICLSCYKVVYYYIFEIRICVYKGQTYSREKFNGYLTVARLVYFLMDTPTYCYGVHV